MKNACFFIISYFLISALSPFTSLSCHSHSNLIFTPHPTMFFSLRFPSHTPWENTLPLNHSSDLLTSAGVLPLMTVVSSGPVGNQTVNLNVPFPGQTNSCFSFSRTSCRTEMSNQSINKQITTKTPKGQMTSNLYLCKYFLIYELHHHPVSQRSLCVVKMEKV
jgi:hypothetical protein